MNDLEQKLQTLREEWKTASLKDRKLIEARANLLNWAKETGTYSATSGNDIEDKPTSSTLTNAEIEELFS